MTKLLVLSDSHGGRAAIERVLMKESKSIDALIFLGDGLRDLELALTLYPKLRAYSVDRKSTRLISSHPLSSRMPSSA